MAVSVTVLEAQGGGYASYGTAAPGGTLPMEQQHQVFFRPHAQAKVIAVTRQMPNANRMLPYLVRNIEYSVL